MERSDLNIQEFFHAVATGPKRRRNRLTPLGLAVFGSSLALVVFGGLLTDRWLGIPALPQGPAWLATGISLLLLGLALCGWCVVLFLRARGTPVPLNPPEALLQAGLYGRTRNPMLTGVFLALFGVGMLLQSTSVVLIWTPAYILIHVLELRFIEEPELEKRFGPAYVDYKRRVPMFFPRLRPRRGPSKAG
jgi:protein-S-isoprenylcysteine O-methyltransferase Ste14